MNKLEEILIPENIVLVDWSIGINWKYANFRNKDGKALKSCCRRGDETLEIFQHPSAFTIEPVIQEIRNLNNILSCVSYSQPENPEYSRSLASRHKKPFKMLRKIKEKVERIIEIAEKKDITKHLPIEMAKYDYLSQMIILLDRNIGVKEDTKEWLKNPKAKKPSDTDERFLAMAYYLSMFSDKKPVLLIADGDFPKLFHKLTGIIGCYEFGRLNQDFRDKIRKNPPSIYFKISEGYVRDTIPFKHYNPSSGFHKEFNLESKRQKSGEIKTQMIDLWRQFNLAQ